MRRRTLNQEHELYRALNTNCLLIQKNRNIPSGCIHKSQYQEEGPSQILCTIGRAGLLRIESYR